MSLSPGTRLGPYEIVALLGRGGMGEVYRARDPRLNREVAVKVSTEKFNDRFEREARAVAALNHPNICHLYDIGPNYLVMELVEGQILRGPVPLDEALRIAGQIAQALEAAHEKGIIHRDLKPANIKLTPDGMVKVLDFGLARISLPEPLDPENSPTLLSMPTQAGAILGTAAYMAPEQARGKSVDKRADIWAFGVVLYEIVVGKPLFAGETTTDVLAGVLTKDPDLNAAPPSVRFLLKRCLEKDPKKRLRDIGDYSEVLNAAERTAPPRVSKLPWATAAAGVALAIGMAIWLAAGRREPPEMRTDIVTPPAADRASFALSPDGRRIAYIAVVDGQQSIWVRSLDSGSTQQIVGTGGAGIPFWSPDSRSLGFFADGKIKRTDLSGGTPQTIADTPGRYGADWSPQGVILFLGSPGDSLFRVSASGGQATPVTRSGPAIGSPRLPRFLPDGKRFLFYSTGAEPGIYLGNLGGGEPKRLTAADYSAAEYLASGWLLYIQQNALQARRCDATAGRLSGDAVRLAEGVAAFSVSRSGLIAWRKGAGSRRQLVWFNRSGARTGSMGGPEDLNFRDPELSPDGRRVAATRPVGETGSIWTVDSSRATRLTFEGSDDRGSVWSPDGKKVAFTSNRGGTHNLYARAADGSGAEEILLASQDEMVPNSWSPDGRFILYQTRQNGGDLMVLPLEGQKKPYAFLSTQLNEAQGTFSPDGKWVAYSSTTSGRAEVYVRPFPTGGGVWQISTGGGKSPRWGMNGKELYYLGAANKLMAVGITAQGGSVTWKQPSTLFAANFVNSNIRAQYNVSREGRFLVNLELADTSTPPITLLQNWKPPK